MESCPKLVKVDSHLDRHHLVEKWIRLCGGFTGEEGEAFVALVAFVVPHLSNVDVLPLKRKELRETNLTSRVSSTVTSLLYLALCVTCFLCIPLCLYHLGCSLCIVHLYFVA